jgi:hypothetical protein
VRVRPGEDHRFPVGAFKDKETGETYIVSPNLRDYLAGDIQPTLLVVCVSRNSPLPFLWGLTLPGADGRPNRWHESAIEAAKIAEGQWTKVSADMSGGCYSVSVAVGNLPEPDWSEVLAIGELMKLSFKDRFIGSTDHPVLKRLRGEL